MFRHQVKADSAYAKLKDEFKSTRTCWSKNDEFYCHQCGTSIGKNLKGIIPFWNATDHMKDKHPEIILPFVWEGTE